MRFIGGVDDMHYLRRLWVTMVNGSSWPGAADRQFDSIDRIGTYRTWGVLIEVESRAVGAAD
jgi:hypothetical protein